MGFKNWFREWGIPLVILAGSMAILLPIASYGSYQERLRQDGIYNEGRNAAIKGVPVQACPFSEWNNATYETHWKRGWADGFMEPKSPEAKR